MAAAACGPRRASVHTSTLAGGGSESIRNSPDLDDISRRSAHGACKQGVRIPAIPAGSPPARSSWTVRRAELVNSIQVVINLEILENSEKFAKYSGRFGPPRAPGWPETDSPRKIITKSGVETRIRALGARFVAIFRFRKNCDVDYNLSSKVTSVEGAEPSPHGFTRIVEGASQIFMSP